MVQKSVVVVATKPYYGAIRSILDPCTQAYFEQGYFNQREILQTAYSHFQTKFNGSNAQLREAVYLGIPVQQLITKFGRNALILYKMLFLYVILDICSYLEGKKELLFMVPQLPK